MKADDTYIEQISRATGMRITRLNHRDEDYQNRHFHGRTTTGVETFVKVILANREYWQRAIAAAPIIEPLWTNTPRLLDYGCLNGNDEYGTAETLWLIYEWKKLNQFKPDPPTLEKVGAMVGKLHTATRSPDSRFARHDLNAEIIERTGHLDQSAPAAADRIRALHSRWGPTELPGEEALIHSDLHWRNVSLDSSGNPVIVDLENVQASHPLMDFGKLIEHDSFADDTHRSAFFYGYDREATPVWPWHEAVRLVRLWTTTGILVYSLARSLSDLAKHGYLRLAQLEQEAGITTSPQDTSIV